MRFDDSNLWLPLALALLALAALAWRAWRSAVRSTPSSRLAIGARLLGIGLLLFSLTNPQRISERPIRGANVVAIVADNSQGLRVRDVGAIEHRGEIMRQSLEGRGSEWLAQLQEGYQIRKYSFDKRLQRVASFQSLAFDGERSDLAHALSEVDARLGKLPLAGIALLSDGNATDLAQLPHDLSHLPPVFPIVIGRDTPIPDLALATVTLAQSAFDDSPLSLRASLTTQALRNTVAEVVLTRLPLSATGDPLQRQGEKQVIERKRVPLASSGSGSAPIRFDWTPRDSGIQFYEISASQGYELDAEQPAEATLENNRRIVVADRGADRYRILYVTGRPNWEYKFLNRSLAEDPQLDLVALIRVAQREPKFEFRGRSGESGNPLYRGFGREDELERFDESVLIRMNTRDEQELKTGFPKDAETLFAYDAVIVDDLEADFFTFSQQTLLRDFVKQRGGGLLLLGGINSLNDGDYQNSPLAQALPVYLDQGRTPAELNTSIAWNLTREGWVEPWTRLRASEMDERKRLQSMPLLKVSNVLPHVKPGSTTLATVEDTRGRVLPALVTRNFGAGRVASVTVGDFWRWGMQGPAEKADLAQFWRQVSRWLVTDNPRAVSLNASTEDDGVVLTVDAKDKEYRPLEVGSARVTVQRVAGGRGGDKAEDDKFASLELPMTPVANNPGQFSLRLPLDDEGAYLARATVKDAKGIVVGEAEAAWVSQPLVDEFASIQPNREALERIARATGGRVLELSELDSLSTELEKRPTPMTETRADPLWHNNWLFLAALGCFLAEWMIRRRKGLP